MQLILRQILLPEFPWCLQQAPSFLNQPGLALAPHLAHGSVFLQEFCLLLWLCLGFLPACHGVMVFKLFFLGSSFQEKTERVFVRSKLGIPLLNLQLRKLRPKEDKEFKKLRAEPRDPCLEADLPDWPQQLLPWLATPTPRAWPLWYLPGRVTWPPSPNPSSNSFHI